MTKQHPQSNVALAIAALNTLFNDRDYDAAAGYFSDEYIQHSAQLPPGRDGLFSTVRGLPADARWEYDFAASNDEIVIIHGRYSGLGTAASWIAADVFVVRNNVLVEHWDVVQDEATRAESVSGRPMFGDTFPS